MRDNLADFSAKSYPVRPPPKAIANKLMCVLPFRAVDKVWASKLCFGRRKLGFTVKNRRFLPFAHIKTGKSRRRENFLNPSSTKCFFFLHKFCLKAGQLILPFHFYLQFIIPGIDLRRVFALIAHFSRACFDVGCMEKLGRQEIAPKSSSINRLGRFWTSFRDSNHLLGGYCLVSKDLAAKVWPQNELQTPKSLDF